MFLSLAVRLTCPWAHTFRKQYTSADMSKSLRDNGLTPSAVSGSPFGLGHRTSTDPTCGSLVVLCRRF